jgi:hypothetical protein
MSLEVIMAVGDGFHPVQCFEVSSQDEAETEEFVGQMYVGNRSRLGAGRGGARFSVEIAAAAVYRQRFGVLPSQTVGGKGHRR